MNYTSQTRTNYVRLADGKTKQDWDNLISNIMFEDFGEIIDSETKKGEPQYGFIGKPLSLKTLEDSDFDYDELFNKIVKQFQSIIHPDDVLIIEEIGSEGDRYYVAQAEIITTKLHEVVTLQDAVENKLSELHIEADNFPEY